MMYLFLPLHFIMCALAAVLMRRGALRAPLCMLPLMLCVPVIGFCAVLTVHFAPKPAAAASLESVASLAARYESIFKTQSAGDAVPLADALLLDDAATRRALMLDALSQSPEEYAELFRRARRSTDSEISHYAATALAELDKSCAQALALAEAAYAKEPKSERLCGEYIACIERCLKLSEADAELKAELGKTLAAVITAQLEAADDAALLLKLFNLRLADGEFDAAEALCGRIKKACLDGTYLICIVRLCFARRDGARLHSLTEFASQSGAYLTKSQKSILEYWK